MAVQIHEFTESEVAAQPIGYWSDLAARTVLTRIRGELAEEGLTQPHWWTLNHAAGAPGGWQRDRLAARLGTFAVPAVDFDRVFDDLVERGWLTETPDGFTVTEAGEAGRLRAKQRLAAAHESIHDGIPAAEYAGALNVLRRMIANLGGDATPPS